jgi:nucleotide-binding universal stress UspA family protein
MASKLITVAIKRVEQAAKLKSIFARNGIASYIQDININQYSVTEGVRVRIEQKDLPKALSILDKIDKNQYENFIENEVENNFVQKNAEPCVLVPLDFSEYSLNACKSAFEIAFHLNLSVVLLHAYLLPQTVFAENISSIVENETLQQYILEKNKDMFLLCQNINQKIDNKQFKNVFFTHLIAEGLPEDVILQTVSDAKAQIVIMGTRGKNHKEQDLIGSVTAEVIEHSPVPVLAIPENTTFDVSNLQNVLFATNFDDKTLHSLDKMMLFLGKFDFNLIFTHFEKNSDSWNEIKLAGIKTYFSDNYAHIKTDYAVISGKDELEAFDKMIVEKKINLIVLNTHKRNIFARLFNPSMARKMVFHATTPILVFHT